MAPGTRLSGDDVPADPREALALLSAERERTHRALEPDVRLLYGVWGAAWLLGFLALWTATTDRLPLPVPVAGATFGALLVLAMVVTGVHIARRTVGVRGDSSTVGAMYGWAWFLGFGALVAIMTGVQRSGVPDGTTALLWPVLSGLVTGLLYLGGGALWRDRVQYGLGLWIIVSSAAGAVAGFPAVHLVMALAGGGGFLVAATVLGALQRRCTP